MGSILGPLFNGKKSKIIKVNKQIGDIPRRNEGIQFFLGDTTLV